MRIPVHCNTMPMHCTLHCNALRRELQCTGNLRANDFCLLEPMRPIDCAVIFDLLDCRANALRELRPVTVSRSARRTGTGTARGAPAGSDLVRSVIESIAQDAGISGTGA